VDPARKPGFRIGVFSTKLAASLAAIGVNHCEPSGKYDFAG
jgi:hypothetical protein